MSTPSQPQITFHTPQLTGQTPPVRGGHTTVLASYIPPPSSSSSQDQLSHDQESQQQPQAQIIVFGGHAYLGDSVFEYYNDTWVLDLTLQRWERARPLGEDAVEKRYGHTSNLVGSRMFVFGGLTQVGNGGGNGSGGNKFMCLNTLHVLDLQEWKFASITSTSIEKPSPRLNHASLSIGRKILIHGGWNSKKIVYGDLWVFDTSDFTWVQPRCGGLVPSGLYGHSLVMSGNNRDVIMYGGCSLYKPVNDDDGENAGAAGMMPSTPQYHNDLRLLDTSTMLWSRCRNTAFGGSLGDIPSGRFNFSFTSISGSGSGSGSESGSNSGSNEILVFGGWGNGGMMDAATNKGKGKGKGVCYILASTSSLPVEEKEDEQEQEQEQEQGDDESMTWIQPSFSAPNNSNSRHKEVESKYGHETVYIGGGQAIVVGGWNGKQAVMEVVVLEIK